MWNVEILVSGKAGEETYILPRRRGSYQFCARHPRNRGCVMKVWPDNDDNDDCDDDDDDDGDDDGQD